MTRLAFFAALALLAACSGANADSDGTNGEDSDGSGDSTLFACGTDECDTAAGEFCIIEYYSNGEYSTSHCVVADCTDCPCAQDETAAYFDGANNCEGIVGCTQSDAELTVECTNQPF